MKVILLKDIKGVGRRFEEKEVSDGHARNFLMPKKLAVPAEGSAAAEARAQKEREVGIREKNEKSLLDSLAQISGARIMVKERANDKGHLFSGISAEKLSEILKLEKGLSIEPKNFLIDAPLKELGEHEIGVHAGGGKEARFTLVVEAK